MITQNVQEHIYGKPKIFILNNNKIFIGKIPMKRFRLRNLLTYSLHFSEANIKIKFLQRLKETLAYGIDILPKETRLLRLKPVRTVRLTEAICYLF